jgi:hypothetical protein
MEPSLITQTLYEIPGRVLLDSRKMKETKKYQKSVLGQHVVGKLMN